MSGKTRSQSPSGALEHVIKVLSHPNFKLIFDEAGFVDIYDFIATDPIELKSLTAVDEKMKIVSLKVAQISKLKIIQDWFSHQSSRSIAVWYELSPKIIDEHLFTTPVSSTVPSSVPVPDPVSSSSSKPKSSSRTVLFGVKRNISDYPKFRDDNLWRSFNRNFKAIAATH